MNTQVKDKTESKTRSPEIQTAPLNKLVLDELNVRQDYNEETIAKLAANIAAKGQLQNVLVRKHAGGKFGVVAGGRRLKALQLLLKQKKIKATYQVKIALVSDEEALEVSISENTHREAVHPADEFAAWEKLHQSGHSVSQIATSHGVTETTVMKRLKLGALHPEILRQYKEDKLSDASVMAFTLSPSHEEQLAVLKTAGNNPRSIKNSLTQNEVRGANFIAKYVGVDDYQKAGGKLRTSLFDDDVFLIDSNLLDKLSKAKLEKDIEALKAEGWTWVEELKSAFWEVADKYDRIYPEGREYAVEEASRLKQIEALVEAAHESDEDLSDKIEVLESERDTIVMAASGFNSSQMDGYGCFCYISGDGKFKVEAGLKLKDKTKKKAAKPETVSGFSNAIETGMKLVRRDCIKASLLSNPKAFVEYAQFELIRNFIAGETTFLGLKNDAFRRNHDEWNKAPFECSQEVEPFGELTSDEILHDYSLPKWLKADVSTAFPEYQKLDDETKLKLVAFALSFSLQTSWKGENYSNEGIELLLQQLDFEPRAYWKPDITFFKRLSKPQMLDLIKELIGEKAHERMLDCKKSEIADELGAIFAASIGEHPDVKDKAVFDRIAAWSPKGMAV